MGKNLIQQARGKGGPTYRCPSFNFVGQPKHPPMSDNTITGTIKDIVHCPGHYSPLMIVRYEDGKEALSLAPDGIRVGDKVSCGNDAEIKPGNVLPLSQIPDGTLIHNLESMPGDGGKFARSSGNSARILSRSGNSANVMLPSKKERTFVLKCRAAIGTPAGAGRVEKVFLKCGKMWHKMKARNKLYPRSSPSKMNAVDHPFGNKRSLRKSKARPCSRDAPPGRKVGMIAARRTGRKNR